MTYLDPIRCPFDGWRRDRKPVRASSKPGRRLIVTSAEGTRMKGLRAIPAERREAAVRRMLEAAR